MSAKYDKILRENIESIIPFIVEHLLNIQVKEIKEIKDKLQVTIQRETDYVCIIIQVADQFILHLEFQTTGDKDMAARMLLYKSMLYHKYNLPVKQYLIYLGEHENPDFPISVEIENLNYKYDMIKIRDIPVATFLKATTPEGVILGILADFKGLSADIIIRMLIHRVQELSKDDNRLQKCIVHLRIFSQLRKLQTEILNQTNIMALEIDIRKDPVFAQGKLEGKMEGKTENSRLFVTNLIRNTDFDDDKIAFLAGVTPEFVRGVRKTLKK